MFDRNIKHIWLLHDNLINSYAMEDLLKLVTNLGYNFITLEEALKDNAYLESDNYYESFGTSWLYRWDYTRGKVIDWKNDPEPNTAPYIIEKKIDLIDKNRNRDIPVQIYFNADLYNSKLPLIIISNGYTNFSNDPKYGPMVTNLNYSDLANSLVENGYFVASIQHDLITDAPLPRPQEGIDLYTQRKPIWERGVQNIKFVLEELKKSDYKIDFGNITLIGHSNGGDISMLFATENPNMIKNVISLDSLRMPFPRTNHPRILSLRASDTIADKDVLLDKNEQNIKIIKLNNAKHMDLCDLGPDEVKLEMREMILNFLNNK